ncbi:MAG TPA: ion channel [Myxococcota bacterium]|nr:ion channel [Myxococcota bacterium]
MSLSEPRDKQLPAFLTLLVTLIAGVMLVPILVPDAAHLVVGRVLSVAILLTALWAAGVRPIRLLFFVPLAVAYFVAHHMGGVPAVTVALSLRAVFFAYTTVLIVLHVLRARTVTGDTIAGAACAYALTAVTWANLYEILELLRPGSFQIPPSWLLQPSGDPSFALQYFSFITLTTVGYGDILPLNPRAGGLCIAEAVVGQLYVAIMIARLVGLQLVQQPSASERR